MAAKTVKDSDRRRYPRRPTQVKVKLEAVGSRGLSFEATLPSFDVSIGGVFLESEFFVNLGTELIVHFDLPGVEESVQVQGTVVREQRSGNKRRAVRTGFAIEFEKFVADAKLTLASFFLAPEIRDFVNTYRRSGRHKKIRDEKERMVDVIVGWEMERLEKGASRLRA